MSDEQDIQVCKTCKIVKGSYESGYSCTRGVNHVWIAISSRGFKGNRDDTPTRPEGPPSTY